MDNIQIIRDVLNKYNYVGIRGLNNGNENKKYRKGQYLAKSFDTWSDDDWHSKKQLRGTCAIQVTDYMTDEQIQKVINNVKPYARNNKIIIIASDYYIDGADNNEVIMYNIVGFDYRGATFISYLN